MAHYEYRTHGTCSKLISFDIEEGRLHGVRFLGGCDGHLKAIGRLTEGQDARVIADTLRGNLCRQKGTSCADQLAKAIDEALGAKA